MGYEACLSGNDRADRLGRYRLSIRRRRNGYVFETEEPIFSFREGVDGLEELLKPLKLVQCERRTFIFTNRALTDSALDAKDYQVKLKIRKNAPTRLITWEISRFCDLLNVSKCDEPRTLGTVLWDMIYRCKFPGESI